MSTFWLVVLLLLILLIIAAMPSWSYSRTWGYYPSSGLGVILIIIIILLLMGFV